MLKILDFCMYLAIYNQRRQNSW